MRSKSEEILVRHIANKYIKEMFTKITSEKVDKAILEENESRIAKGMQEMTSWKEQLTFEGKLYSKNDEEAKKLVSILYVGVESEYGIDRQAVPEQAPLEEKPVFESALESVQKEKDNNIVSTEPPKSTSKGFSCDHPGCDYTTDVKIALFQHKRGHRSDAKEKAVAGVSK